MVKSTKELADDWGVKMDEDYHDYHKCPKCEFDLAHANNYAGTIYCPECGYKTAEGEVDF